MSEAGTARVVIDLNADLGELPGDEGRLLDDALLQVVTSASIACGGHAGSPTSVRTACVAAARAGVAVGAHVSYVDREGFGRRPLEVAVPLLVAQLGEQLETLEVAARAAGTAVTYLKPHGALYHAAAADPATAGAVIDAVLRHGAATGRPLSVLGAPGSMLLTMAQAVGLAAVPEGFADRGYRPDGTLVPRGEPGDLVVDPDDVIAQVVALASTGLPPGVDPASPVRVASVCLHSDTPSAVVLARAVRDGLWSRHVALRAFAPPPGSG